MSDRTSNSHPDHNQDQNDAAMDSLLRQAMSAPVPRLSPDFHQALSRRLRRSSQPLNPFGRNLLAAYTGFSAVISVVVMHGQGLGWSAIAVTILAPLATLELVRRVRRKPLRPAAR